MSATVTAPAPPLLGPDADGRSPPRSATLEQRLEACWGVLRSGGAAACPLCQGPMQAAADGGGSCTSCGAHLS
jgi:hypothetical protein